ncbi:UNVERIFIED_CONTAM: hypothetical protein K2H54_039982 [Gekko kuhli]
MGLTAGALCMVIVTVCKGGSVAKCPWVQPSTLKINGTLADFDRKWIALFCFNPDIPCRCGTSDVYIELLWSSSACDCFPIHLNADEQKRDVRVEVPSSLK